MSDSAELRTNWRMNWLSCIQEFSDLETQRQLWLDADRWNPHYSFVEYMCCYFDDLGVFDSAASSSDHYAVAREQGFVSADEAAVAGRFHEVVDAYEAPGNDVFNHHAILADPKWAEVVAAAKSAQSALLLVIDNEEERRALMEKNINAVETEAKD